MNLKNIRPRQSKEWDKADFAIMAKPALETFFGIIATDSANFISPFNYKKAIKEHDKYRKILENNGIKVIDIREAMINGTKDNFGNKIEGNKLKKLREKAIGALRYEYEKDISQKDRKLLNKKKVETIYLQEPETLATIILLRPSVYIKNNLRALDLTSRFLSSYKVNPASNSYFMRDPMITTKAGIVIGCFSLDVREVETENIDFALSQLDIKPIYNVKKPGRLEGGDFIPCGDFCLQGQGLLSNREGIDQLLENCCYGFSEVGIVIDKQSSMKEMHLDTYFNILSPNLCCLVENRIGTDNEPIVEVYSPEGTENNFNYILQKKIRFTLYLKEKGMQIISITEKEQQNFAPNYLLLTEKKVVVPSRAGEGFIKKLQNYGVDVTVIDFDELTGGYGGPHCSVQIIKRIK